MLYRHIFRAFVEVNNEYNVKFKNDFMATYHFNTKLIKKFVDAQKERIAEVASNIAPTIYDTNKTVEVMDTMQVISITNTTYNINKLGIKGRDYVGVAMEILDKERYFNEATLHLFNYIFRGNYTEFIQLYKEIYSDKDVIVNEDGKIVLDY